MERGSDKHSARIDEAQKHDTYSITPGGTESRAEEFREQEGPGEGEPTPDARISGDRGSASEDLLSYDEVEDRTEIARHLQPSVFPADRDRLLASAEELHAPVAVLDRLRSLPDGTFEHFEAVWEALGGREDFRGA